MELLERVARAIHEASDNPFAPFDGYMRPMRESQARAAIAAILEGVEPVAWWYAWGCNFWLLSERMHPAAKEHFAETPLYDLSVIKGELDR